MSKYSYSFFQEVYDGLNKTLATNINGKEIDLDEAIAMWTTQIRKIQQETKGLMFFAGNGASASMAEHMSHDFFQNGKVNTYTCSETSHITAISNDLSYEDVFAYRIERILSDKDILVTISSSGNSPNIIKAIKTARKKGVFIVTFSGKGADNKSRQLGDVNFYVPLDTYGLVESAHAVLLHCGLDHFLDTYMGGRH